MYKTFIGLVNNFTRFMWVKCLCFVNVSLIYHLKEWPKVTGKETVKPRKEEFLLHEKLISFPFRVFRERKNLRLWNFDGTWSTKKQFDVSFLVLQKIHFQHVSDDETLLSDCSESDSNDQRTFSQFDVRKWVQWKKKRKLTITMLCTWACSFSTSSDFGVILPSASSIDLLLNEE